MGRIEIVEEPAADGPHHMIGICEENLIDICDENVAVEAGEAAAIAADIEMHPTPSEPFLLPAASCLGKQRFKGSGLPRREAARRPQLGLLRKSTQSSAIWLLEVSRPHFRSRRWQKTPL